jgi:outer membrane protein OmpA-like peptidoglycan-associated protein
MYLSPGLKIGYLRPLIIDLGASFGMNDATPKMELDAGLSTTFTFFKPPKRTTGAIAGKAFDAKTGVPLGATVGLPDEPGLAPVKADSKTGAFKVAKVKAGQVLVEATAKGYQSRTVAAEVVIGKTAQVEFQLEPIVTKGTISGMVVDAKTGSSLQASIECEGAKLKPVGTASDGSFGYSDVAPGEYTLSVSAPDYMKATSRVKVEAGQTARLKIALVKKGMEITMKVYFDFNKADLKPESHQALADAAKIMKENPDIKVEIQGHTDNVGTAAYNDKLSLRRAKAVVDYLVSKLGVDAKRLTAKGYGMGAPVASNDNEEGRSKNRRVEFSILK